VTPDGIVGKVISVYPTASQVELITSPDFAAGVITQKGQVHGTLKGLGTALVKIDYVAFEEKVEPGEWVYTSGDDRIFPRGFPVGIVKAVRPGQPFKEILVEPSGMQRGLVDVLILIEGVHQEIPETPSGFQTVYIAPAPPGGSGAPVQAGPATLGTEADRLYTQYQNLGQEQNHKFGDNPPGARAVDFTKLPMPAGGGRSPVPAAVPPSNGAAAAPAPQAGQPQPNSTAGSGGRAPAGATGAPVPSTPARGNPQAPAGNVQAPAAPGTAGRSTAPAPGGAPPANGANGAGGRAPSGTPATPPSRPPANGTTGQTNGRPAPISMPNSPLLDPPRKSAPKPAADAGKPATPPAEAAPGGPPQE
jgi:hypothetical protein